jgi:hypothetical protein
LEAQREVFATRGVFQPHFADLLHVRLAILIGTNLNLLIQIAIAEIIEGLQHRHFAAVVQLSTLPAQHASLATLLQQNGVAAVHLLEDVVELGAERECSVIARCSRRRLQSTKVSVAS